MRRTQKGKCMKDEMTRTSAGVVEKKGLNNVLWDWTRWVGGHEYV